MNIQSKPFGNKFKLLTPEQVSKILGITIGTLQIWRTTGRYNFPFVKIGSRVMYREEDIQKFINDRTINNTV